MNCNYSFEIKEDVTQINVYKMPVETCFLSQLFSRFFIEGIPVDMICRPLTHTFDTMLSFTINDCDLKKAVKILTKLKDEYKQLKFSICATNAKIIVTSNCSEKSSIASLILDKFCRLNIEILLISTGATDISMLISGSNCMTARYGVEDILKNEII